MKRSLYDRKRKAAMILALSGCMVFGNAIGVLADTQTRYDYSEIQKLTQSQLEQNQNGIPQTAISQTSIADQPSVQIAGAKNASSVEVKDMDGNTIKVMSANNASGQLVQTSLPSSGMKMASSGTVTTSSKISTTSTRNSDDENTSKGPGAGSAKLQVEIRDSEELAGPQVKEVSMGETFHEDYDVYTESIDGRFFIYTNVGNNGITDQPVFLDIPQNISYKAEKDGAPMGYTSKQNIGETGTYIFYFTAVKNPEKPLSEQVIYETTFNFRIQPKSAKAAAAQAAQAAQSSGSYVGSLVGYDLGNRANSDPWTVTWPADQATETEVSTTAADESSILEETQVQEETAAETVEETQEEPAETEPVQPDEQTEVQKSGTMNGFTQTFNYGKGLYEISPDQKKSFVLYSSIPNGMLTETTVLLDTTEMGTYSSEMKILRNGEPYELPEDGIVRDIGSYTVLIPTESNRLVFCFRILTGSCSDLDFYTVPENYTVSSFTRDGINIISDLSGDGRYLNLKEDGEYYLEMTDGVSRYQTTFKVDHVAPEFNVNITGSAAQIEYLSDDVAYVQITHKGQTETYSSITTLNGSGNYTIEVFDAAGNSSVRTINIPHKMNTAAVVAVILVVGLLASAVIFIRRTKNSFNVK